MTKDNDLDVYNQVQAGKINGKYKENVYSTL